MLMASPTAAPKVLVKTDVVALEVIYEDRFYYNANKTNMNFLRRVEYCTFWQRPRVAW